jgi:hypothetical protein
MPTERPSTLVPFVCTEQYNGQPDSLLYQFFATARDLHDWAGVPRKTWRFRSFYQRILDSADRRLGEMKRIWSRSADVDDDLQVLIPTAITVAMPSEPVVHDDAGQKWLDISWTDPAIELGSSDERARVYASLVFEQLNSRLTGESLVQLQEISETESLWDEVDTRDPVMADIVDILRIAKDAERWRSVAGMDINDDRWTGDVIEVLGRIARPAHVIDGQHRLISAAQTDYSAKISLPVVALPSATWADETFHFVSINYKAEPIPASLLRDILANSASQSEADDLRRRFRQVSIDLDILAIAGRANTDEESPFRDMVRLAIEGTDPASGTRFVTPNTIENLTEGAYIDREAGFRVHQQFFDTIGSNVVRSRDEEIDPDDIENAWKHPATGVWWEYFYAFWRAVRDHFNHEALNYRIDRSHLAPLWKAELGQSPLTEAHVMRTIQRVFLDWASAHIREMELEYSRRRDEFVANERRLLEQGRLAVRAGMNEEETLEADWEEHARESGLRKPPDLSRISTFEEFVKRDFLTHIPVRYFRAYWKYQDTNNDERLEMREAFRSIISASINQERSPQWTSYADAENPWRTLSQEPDEEVSIE